MFKKYTLKCIYIFLLGLRKGSYVHEQIQDASFTYTLQCILNKMLPYILFKEFSLLLEDGLIKLNDVLFKLRYISSWALP